MLDVWCVRAFLRANPDRSRAVAHASDILEELEEEEEAEGQSGLRGAIEAMLPERCLPCATTSPRARLQQLYLAAARPELPPRTHFFTPADS